MTTLALTFNGATISLISHKNQTWITTAELSTALGYARSDSVNKIFERNKDEFNDSMTMILLDGQFDHPTKILERQNDVTGEFKGIQREIRFFSLRGCHLIAMFAKTTIAKQFRKWVLDILDKEVSEPKPYGLKEPATISNEQIGELYTRVCAISSDGKIRTAIWSRFQNHFRINSYKALPAEKYDEALIYVEKLHAEYHPKSEPVLTEQQYRRVMNRADYLSKTQCATPLMSIIETIRKEFKVSDIRSIPEAKFAQLCNFLNFSPEQNERDLLVDYFRANDLIERMKKDYIILKKDDPCIIPHFVQQVETLLLPELITQSAAALAVRL